MVVGTREKIFYGGLQDYEIQAAEKNRTFVRCDRQGDKEDSSCKNIVR